MAFLGTQVAAEGVGVQAGGEGTLISPPFQECSHFDREARTTASCKSNTW